MVNNLLACFYFSNFWVFHSALALTDVLGIDFFQCWIGIKISWGSAVGIIKIGPTIAKLAVEN